MNEEKPKFNFKNVRNAVRGKPKNFQHEVDAIVSVPEKPKGISYQYHVWNCPVCLEEESLELTETNR